MNKGEGKIMNWREELAYLRERKPWSEVLIFLEKTADENPDNVEVYVETIYFLLELLLEDSGINFEVEGDKIADILKAFFEKSYKRFSENAEFLFFIGYFMALAEWYFGQNDLQLSKQMQKKAIEIEPENILYEWSYKFSTNDRSAYELSKQLLSDSEKMKWLEMKGVAGEYISNAIKNYYTGYEKSY